MNTRAIEYNNAAVDCFHAGGHMDRISWDLFKGALELKLADEKDIQSQQQQRQQQLHQLNAAHHDGGAPVSNGMLSREATANDGGSAGSSFDGKDFVAADGSAATSTANTISSPHISRNKFVMRAEHHYANLVRQFGYPAAANNAAVAGTAIVDGSSAIAALQAHHDDGKGGSIRDDSARNSFSAGSSDQRDGARADVAAPMMVCQEEDDAATPGMISSRSRGGGNGTYAPYLWSQPLRLSHNHHRHRQPGIASDGRHSPRDEDLTATRKDSAMIIFNLALLDQLRNERSAQAVALYELSMTLITGDLVDELGIALVNNIGVWCYQNGDMEGAANCMRHLMHFLNKCDMSLDVKDKEGLHANVLWILSSPQLASPAA
eukprot:CAMPEP_0119567716 /NCGR_PEP_ID=MMETSP1352-20130426/36752_1 /TAXON_ID=265584 /ORGANISM="Stauroneis constricta, Strain CCMP1120" /LENGTH=376 /DNA_ID=CAMNT_0007617003 /DNA_START=150 /DNA_END=1280 /DNA_ORIENTATION=+